MLRLTIKDDPNGVEVSCGFTAVPVTKALFLTSPLNPANVQFHDLDKREIRELVGDKHTLAFEYAAAIISDLPPHIFASIQIELSHYTRPTIFANPLDNVVFLRFVGITDLNLIGSWFDSITARPVQYLHFVIDHDQIIEGIGMLPMARQAQTFVVTGGQTDITDEQLDQFQAKEVDFKSKFLTQNGIRRFIQKVYYDPSVAEDDFTIMCKFRPEIYLDQQIAPAYCLDRLVPRDVQHDVVVEGVYAVPRPED